MYHEYDYSLKMTVLNVDKDMKQLELSGIANKNVNKVMQPLSKHFGSFL